MQQPDGTLERIKELDAAELKARVLEKKTGKPHPVFFIGEELVIKGGKWRVESFRRNRMVLKAIRY